MQPPQPSILIVDDLPDNIRIVASILQGKNYRMAFALDGLSALESAKETAYDLILLDVMMPGIDGFEVCRRLKQQPETKETPVIFITAKSDQASVIEGFEAGGVDYIAKPFNGAELLARIDTHLRLTGAMGGLKLADKVFQALTEAIIITDSENRIIKINPAFTEITGYSEREALGKNPNMLKSGKGDADFYQAMWQEIQAKGYWHGEIWNKKKCGEVYPESLSIHVLQGWKGKVENYVGVFSDITERKRAEELIRYQAHHDALTDLPNRTLFRSLLDRALRDARACGEKLAILYIDLDGFKEVNDLHGHHFGDWLLATVAKRLRDSVRASDVVARVGGDEFVAILSGLGGTDEAKMVAEKVIAALEAPFDQEKSEGQISGSIGISLFPDDSDEPHRLINYADQAMYGAKRAGKARCLLYRELEASDGAAE